MARTISRHAAMSLSVLGLAVSACAPHNASAGGTGPSAASASSALAATQPTASVPYSPFRVALIEAPLTGNVVERAAVQLCPLHGRTFVCIGDAAPLASTDAGVAVDPAMDRAWRPMHDRDGAVQRSRLVGTWPNDTWLLTNEWLNDESPHVRAYPWKGDAWGPPIAWTGYVGNVTPWDQGLLVDSARRNPEHDEYRLRLEKAGSDGHAAPASQIIDPNKVDNQGDDPDRLEDIASADGTLFLVGESAAPHRLMVERWTGSSSRSRVEEIVRGQGAARLWVKSARDVVVFGGPDGVEGKPVLRHFDGEKWSPLEPPPGVDIVVAYARTDSGTERAFAFAGKELSLWERAAGHTWERIALPALGKGESINKRWLTADDVWLHVWSDTGPGRLLRMHPVEYVAHLGKAGMTKEPALGSDDRLVAAAITPPSSPSSADHASFHVAVVGRTSSSTSDLGNAMTLCPFRGRTFVCGVHDVPLVSTDDGVVPDEGLEAMVRASHGEPFAEGGDDGGPLRAVGSWPDSAWFVAWRPGGVQEKHAYRFRGDHWAPPIRWWGNDDVNIAPWRAGLLVGRAIATAHDTEAFRQHELRLFLPKGPSLAAPASQLFDTARVTTADLSPPTARIRSAGDALFLVAPHDGKVTVERWVDGTAGSRVDAVATTTDDGFTLAPAALWVASRDEAVVYGGGGDAKSEAFLARFDGARWSRLDVPPGTTRVAAYDRTSSGIDRIFAYAGDELSLFERNRGSAWRHVPLPPLASDESIHDLWLANDDAWLLVWNTHMTERAPRLFRMKPVKKTWSYPRERPSILGW